MKKYLLIGAAVIVVAGGIYYVRSGRLNVAVDELSLDQGQPITVKNGQVYTDGDLVEGADPKTFKYIGRGYYQDKSGTYCTQMMFSAYNPPIKISPDIKEFRVLERGYAADSTYGYYDCRELEGSDGPSMEFLDLDMAKDKNYAYHYGSRIEGSDGATFRSDGGEFYFDKNHVYWYRDPIPGADPATFESIGGSYSKDKTHVYFMYSHLDEENGGSLYQIRTVEMADPASFEILMINGLAKDKNHTYFNGRVTSIDSASAKELGSLYVVDARHVYFEGAVIAGADPATFEIFTPETVSYKEYAKDKNYVYKKASVIAEADPATYKFVDNIGWYAADKSFVFYNGKKIEGSDATTFEYDTLTQQGKDKNYEYAYGCLYKDNEQISCVE